MSTCRLHNPSSYKFRVIQRPCTQPRGQVYAMEIVLGALPGQSGYLILILFGGKRALCDGHLIVIHILYKV